MDRSTVPKSAIAQDAEIQTLELAANLVQSNRRSPPETVMEDEKELVSAQFTANVLFCVPKSCQEHFWALYNYTVIVYPVSYYVYIL